MRSQALFALAWFHAIIQERRMYIPQVSSDRYTVKIHMGLYVLSMIFFFFLGTLNPFRHQRNLKVCVLTEWNVEFSETYWVQLFNGTIFLILMGYL